MRVHHADPGPEKHADVRMPDHERDCPEDQREENKVTDAHVCPLSTRGWSDREARGFRRQPLLEHHQDPDHLAVVARGARARAGSAGRRQNAPHDAAFAASRATRRASSRSGSCRASHGPNGRPKPVLLLGDDRVGQEAAQRLLEEPAQLEAVQLERRREREREIDQLVGEQREADRDARERRACR